ncbi:uncharacterized protein [Drosophila virilis]|uniref:Uncharacterized protein n=1 Tax=Drosophila virilis TaxID=7244 RepID=B4LU91_DROVI|nr:uncharacterized protein LOC6627327 [Drosophila virilis]EDW64078.1 uncharacterized protein Dvir_GJ24472 [Drosophila virilis]
MSFELHSCELYPRIRPTEFYRTPEPRVSVQSRKAEHPRENVRMAMTTNANITFPHIIPPRTSGMRVQRNSYFS